MNVKTLISLALGLIFVLALPSMAFGAEESTTVGSVFSSAGTIGWIIVALSVVMFALSIDNFVNIRREKLAPPDLIDEVEALFEAGDYQEAIELCEAEPNFFTNCVAAGLPKLNASFEAMEKSIEEMVEEEALKLHTRIGWLSFISATAPMMGLLGTVSGMISAFNTIAATQGQASPADLSTGISGALVTTMFGLIVALPALFFYTVFRNKVVRCTIEIGAVVEDLFERFRPQKAA